MRRRASRAAIFGAVVAAHLLVLHFLPDLRPPQEVSDREPSIAITFFPTQPQKPLTATSRARQPDSRQQKATASSGQAGLPPRDRKQESANRAALNSAASAAKPRAPPSGHPWIDWERQADAAVADRTERAAEAARRATALSRWRDHVMPAPWAPHGPQFRWDYAATHRFQTTPFGLVINITDRCEIIITLGIFGGCAIGHIPVYGDLFAHMDDPKEPIDSTVP